MSDALDNVEERSLLEGMAPLSGALPSAGLLSSMRRLAVCPLCADTRSSPGWPPHSSEGGTPTERGWRAQRGAKARGWRREGGEWRVAEGRRVQKDYGEAGGNSGQWRDSGGLEAGRRRWRVAEGRRVQKDYGEADGNSGQWRDSGGLEAGWRVERQRLAGWCGNGGRWGRGGWLGEGVWGVRAGLRRLCGLRRRRPRRRRPGPPPRRCPSHGRRPGRRRSAGPTSPARPGRR